MRVLFLALLLSVGCNKVKPEMFPVRPDTIPYCPVEPEALACPDDMVEIEGGYCPTVKETCLKCLDAGKSGPPPWKSLCRRCEQYAPSVCQGARVLKHFCIDTYEFPNKLAEKPEVNLSWITADTQCVALGKRLCTESEWTFACEGESMQPYPYGDGFNRNDGACNAGKQWLDPFAYLGKTKQVVGLKPILEVDQRAISGSFGDCTSPFGVHDMVANVDEWVRNEWVRSSSRHVSLLKGGHWVKGARNRCRGFTSQHGPKEAFYVTGARCCADSLRTIY